MLKFELRNQDRTSACRQCHVFTIEAELEIFGNRPFLLVIVVQSSSKHNMVFGLTIGTERAAALQVRYYNLK